MDGFTAYKYYLALKLHFTDPKYDVFEHKGRVRAARDKFDLRNDRSIFEALARKFDTDKEFIQYVASNFMYGNQNVYDADLCMQNYKLYIKRKQAITQLFKNDTQVIVDSNAQYEFSGQKIPDVIQLYLGGRISIETIVILDHFDNIVEKMKQNQHIEIVLGTVLMVIEKSRKFIKYDPYRVMNVYTDFIEQMQTTEA